MPWCRLIGVIHDETDIKCSGKSMEDISVPNGPSSILVQLKNQTWKRVSGRELKSHLMDDGDQQL